MRIVDLGSTGLKVSEMCMGAMMFGTKVDEKTSRDILDAYMDAGGNFIDTSNNYAHWWKDAVGDESEKLLGRWMKDRGNRDKIVLATKVGFDRKGAGEGLRAHQIMHWCDESLKNLNTDVIDLYYAHVDDMKTPMEETMEAFDRLIKAGKVRNVGASNHYAWRLMKSRMMCEQKGFTPYSVLEAHYSYLYMENGLHLPYRYTESVAAEMMDFLAQYKMPLVAYSCNAGGGYKDEKLFPEGYIKGERLNVLNNMAKEKNVPANVLMLAWMMQSWRFRDRPQIIPLFGAGTLEHLKENLSATEVSLTTEEAEILNRA